MDISIIIPTYKPDNYIWQCLESINTQTLDRDKFEVNLILNGCNEPWNSQLKRWITTHPDLNIKLIQTDTPGVSNARNIGLNTAQGQYIIFLDDDDYISPSYLYDMLENADDNTIILSNSVSFVDGTLNFNDSYVLRKLYYSLKKRKSISLIHARSIFNGPCMKLIPISFMQGVSFNTAFKNGEDSLFMFELSKNITKIRLSPETAIYYRRNRINSAYRRKKSLHERATNAYALVRAYSNAYLRHPTKYNIIFYLSRILGTIKGHIIQP